MFDARTKFMKFINDSGSLPKAAAILGYSAPHFYNMRDGKTAISEEVLRRIDAGGGERRTLSDSGKASAASKAYVATFRFDANADFSAMDELDITRFIGAIETRLKSQRDIIETAMEKARVATAEAESRIPALMELGRKAVAEQTKRQMRKFGASIAKSPTVVTDVIRQGVLASSDGNTALAARYGISVTTVKRIRKAASNG